MFGFRFAITVFFAVSCRYMGGLLQAASRRDVYQGSWVFKMYKKIIVLSLGAVLAACNSGSSSSRGTAGSSPEPPLTQGRFIDSPVGGLLYETNSLTPNTTDSNGTFEYRLGEEVRFLLGEQVIAKATGKAVLTLLDVVPGARADRQAGATLDEIYNAYPQILNIARLLQSLDVDRSSDNGLQIPIDAQRIAGQFGVIDFSAADLYADDASQGYKFICEVLKSRAPAAQQESACDGNIVVSREDAAAEVTATENAVDSGASINYLPVASAGRDQIVAETRMVQLPGSATDVDGSGGFASVRWYQSNRDGVELSSPTIVLTNSEQFNASFTAPDVQQEQNFYFTLAVTDIDGGIGTDTVAILVVNDSDLDPVADAGPDQLRVAPGAEVVLDGSMSSDDLDGGNLAFNWRQSSGLAVELSGADTAMPTFVAPSPDDNALLTFELTVTDTSGQSDSDTVNINVQVNPGLTPPEANAGDDQNVTSGDSVELDGSGSADADGDPLDYSWSQVDVAEGTAVTLSGENTERASFVAPDVEETTTLRFRLLVSDGLNETADEVDVTVAPSITCDITDINTYPVCFEELPLP